MPKKSTHRSSTQSVSFPLGQVVTTPAAREAIEAAGHTPQSLLDRHAAGDWGDLSDEDKEQNTQGVKRGHRLLSAYTLVGKQKVWVITEADRRMTRIMLPEEY